MKGTARHHLLSAIGRTAWVVLFAGGSVVHLVMGRGARAEQYASFGKTAWEPLSRLWESFVMPNIGPLTLGMAAVEASIAFLLARGGTAGRIGAGAAIAFFTFLIPLGYGYTGLTGMQDFLTNRLTSLVMIALMAPFAARAYPPLLAEWRSLGSRRHALS